MYQSLAAFVLPLLQHLCNNVGLGTICPTTWLPAPNAPCICLSGQSVRDLVQLVCR
jgi:hypothetical protein